MWTSISAIRPAQVTESSPPRPEPLDGSETPHAAARARLNVSILQASLEVSIQSQNEPLALLFKSAIAGINELLAPEFGDNAIEAAASQDNTPKGTAGRIVALSTGFFEAFKEQHVGEDAAGVLQAFMATIRGGFEQGFKEARDILQGMNVLDGDIANGIERTYELVLKGYAEFEAAQGGNSTPSEDASAG